MLEQPHVLRDHFYAWVCNWRCQRLVDCGAYARGAGRRPPRGAARAYCRCPAGAKRDLARAPVAALARQPPAQFLDLALSFIYCPIQAPALAARPGAAGSALGPQADPSPRLLLG